MSSPRSAAILLAVLAPAGLAGPADAASSRLTPAPPAAFTPVVAQPVVGGPSAAPSVPGGSDLPRTGIDLPRELLLAGVLLGAGGILRLRRAPDQA
jgi:hypothetical protein